MSGCGQPGAGRCTPGVRALSSCSWAGWPGLAGLVRVAPHRLLHRAGTGRSREDVLRDNRVRGGGHRSARRAGGHGRRDLPGEGCGTLLDVLATDLSSAEVVLGKLAARLLPVLATIAAALPVLAITSLFGGIDPAALGGSFAVVVGLAVLGWRSPCRSRSGAGRPTRCCWRCTSSGSAGCCSCRSGSL